MTNKIYCITLLCHVILFFCVSCATLVTNNIKKISITVPISKPQIELPIHVKNMNIYIENKSSVSINDLHEYTKLYLVKHYPRFIYSAEGDCEITLKISAPEKRITQSKISHTEFKNNLAHLPIQTYTIEKQNVLMYSVFIEVKDRDINHIINQKQYILEVENEGEFLAALENCFHPKKEEIMLSWMKNKISEKALSFLLSEKVDDSLRDLTQKINKIDALLMKKKQISLQQTYNLGTLYHNRYIILNFLKYYMGAQRDRQRAQIIFSTLTGKNYDFK